MKWFMYWCVCTGWSGPLLPAYRISRYCSKCWRTENVLIRLHGCIHSSRSSLFAYGIRAFFPKCTSNDKPLFDLFRIKDNMCILTMKTPFRIVADNFICFIFFFFFFEREKNKLLHFLWIVCWGTRNFKPCFLRKRVQNFMWIVCKADSSLEMSSLTF